MSKIHLDKEAFQRRLKRLFAAMREDSNLKKCDALVAGVGKDKNIVYSKSSALQIWLLGYELTDTIILITGEPQRIFFLASKNKIEFIKQADDQNQNQSNQENQQKTMVLLLRDKINDRGNFDQLIQAIKSSRLGGKSVGYFAKDNYSGQFLDSWRMRLKSENFELTDVSAAVGQVMAPKDDTELMIMRKSCQITQDLFNKYLKDQIMEIIDADKKEKHARLADGVEFALCDKKYVTAGVDLSQIQLCYPCIVQSGSSGYSLKFSAVSDKALLHFGTILCFLGCRYKLYCSNMVRTLLVNPQEQVQKNYEFLVHVEEEILGRLRHNVKLSDVYQHGLDFVKKENPQLVEHLTKNFGFLIGIEFKESSMLICPKSVGVAKKQMCFNVNVGFHNLANALATDPESKVYSLFVGDTVLVGDDGGAIILTSSKKKIKNIGIFLKDDEEEDSNEDNDEKMEIAQDKMAKASASLSSVRSARRTAVLDSKLRTEHTSEEKRKEHQRELGEMVNARAKDRLAKQSGGTGVEKVRKNTVSYKTVGQMPRVGEVREGRIYVDQKYETVILPIYGVATPFHISTIKNISQSVEGDYTYLRINFYHPGSTMGGGAGKEWWGGAFQQPEATFLKEMTYRSTNVKEPGELTAPSSNLNTAFRLIKEVQRKFKIREAELKEKEDLVKQDSLILSTNKGNPKLKDLFIRPNIVSKRMTGSLEAHQNGFRYTSVRGDKVDILYNNIKNAFFQPCDGEMIILLHFHLKNAIMFGKKKHIDVQFYTEVGEITTDLGKHQHMHDRDDLAAEQAERELRHKLKTAFRSFCEKVEAMTRQEIEFDKPFRELGFPGVPYRSTVLLQPTSGCLVHLTEWPPFVITLDDVELVHFERIQFQLKNFDMVFIFRDYYRKTAMVTAIPMHLLDHVKEWLNSCDIRYTGGLQSLNWTTIMKTIVTDSEAFFEQGGWSFLDADSGGEEPDGEEPSESEDEVYQPSDFDGSATEESEEDSEYSEGDTEESEGVSDDGEEELGSEEESGKDWSDLEREAAEEDRERTYDGFEQGKGAGSNSSKVGGAQGTKKSATTTNGASSSSATSQQKRRHHSSSGSGGGRHRSSSSGGGGASSSGGSRHHHHHHHRSSSGRQHSSSSSRKPSSTPSAASSSNKKRSRDDDSKHHHRSATKRARK